MGKNAFFLLLLLNKLYKYKEGVSWPTPFCLCRNAYFPTFHKGISGCFFFNSSRHTLSLCSLEQGKKQMRTLWNRGNLAVSKDWCLVKFQRHVLKSNTTTDGANQCSVFKMFMKKLLKFGIPVLYKTWNDKPECNFFFHFGNENLLVCCLVSH